MAGKPYELTFYVNGFEQLGLAAQTTGDLMGKRFAVKFRYPKEEKTVCGTARAVVYGFDQALCLRMMLWNHGIDVVWPPKGLKNLGEHVPYGPVNVPEGPDTIIFT